jgi:beta-N-acetylhexosaminidase
VSVAVPLVIAQIRLPGDYARLEEFIELARSGGVGGFIVFGGDLDLTPRFLERLREGADARPLLIMSDVERGVGQQIDGCMRHPPNMAVGALRDPGAAYALGVATAVECRKVGIDMALGPCLDLYVDSRNPIVGPRSFGEDPELVAELGAAWIQGCQEEGVLACAKHFPGHGRTVVDSHDDIVSVEADVSDLQSDLMPFRRAVDAGVAAVMTAHVAFPALQQDSDPGTPATLSPAVVQNILRTDMAFDGLVLTDALLMDGVRKFAGGETDAALRALRSGCDLLLCPTDAREVAEGVHDAVAADLALEQQAVDAGNRLDSALKVIGERPSARPPAGMDQYRDYAMAAASITTLRDPGRLLPLRRPEGNDVIAIVLDDDDRPGREEPVRDRADAFPGGILRCTPESVDRPMVVGRAESADRVFCFLYGDVRAWKNRPGLHAELAEVVDALQARLADRLVLVALGTPVLAADGPGTAVCAWDDAPLIQKAALDLLLDGRTPTGRVPWGPDPLSEGEPR